MKKPRQCSPGPECFARPPRVEPPLSQRTVAMLPLSPRPSVKDYSASASRTHTSCVLARVVSKTVRIQTRQGKGCMHSLWLRRSVVQRILSCLFYCGFSWYILSGRSGLKNKRVIRAKTLTVPKNLFSWSEYNTPSTDKYSASLTQRALFTTRTDALADGIYFWKWITEWHH